MALPFDDTVVEAPLTLGGIVADLHADGRLTDADRTRLARLVIGLSLIHISEPTRQLMSSRMPSSA